jgi:hypothetical protein
MTNTEGEPSFDDMVDAVAHIQRRKLLIALLEHNPQDDTPIIVADSKDDADALERLVSMQHVHLPKLVDYGFIEWDKDSHEVVKGPNFDAIKPLLRLLDDHEDELPDDWLWRAVDTLRGDLMTDSAERTASTAVIEAVATHDEIDPLDVTPPLCEAIDPDGLNAVCRTSSVRVSFQYHGYLVTIDGENQVDLTEIAWRLPALYWSDHDLCDKS